MMRVSVVALLLCMPTLNISAQSTAVGSIPVRSLHNFRTSDSTTLQSISGIRRLPGGSVLVNDANRRQLVLFDSSLAHARVIADTSSRSEYSYGLRPKAGALIPYVADSTIFADNESSVLLVINPVGEIVNVVAPVRARDLNTIVAGQNGKSSFDASGRLIYASARAFDLGLFLPAPGEGPKTVTHPDSAPIVRADFDERSVDTIAMIKIAVQKTVLIRSNAGGVSPMVAVNPLPASDDWTMMPDGTIAIVRVKDYHMDWISPDGKLTSSPVMPFDWRRISAEEKQAMVDSVKRSLDEASARDLESNPPAPGQPDRMRLNFTVEASDIPDNYPPVRTGQTLADMNGHVWVLPSTSASAVGGLLFDVVNRQGVVIERVQLPAGRRLVGFGPGDLIYMSRSRGAQQAVLERAEIAR